jgi:hypothetical protein
MSFSDSEGAKVRKQIVLRYPFTFYEEVSRQLIIFKTFRGNKKIFRALPITDELIDYSAMEPLSGKWIFEMTPEEKSKYELINIPEDLISTFKDIYHGTDEKYDDIIGLKHLAPGNSMNDDKATVIIRKAIRFIEAYGDHTPEWTAMIAGFAYKITVPSPSGFPITETVPMVDADDPDLEYTYTTEIPRSVWAHLFETMWAEIAPVCTRIERVIAATLTEKGFKEGIASMPQADYQSEAGDASDTEDPQDLS